MENESIKILWARMPGFPFWPARNCTIHEKAVLDLNKSPKNGLKTSHKAVIFLGTSYQRYNR
jgi:hypothetical protein